MGPILFACNENCAYDMHMCSDVMHASCGAHTQASWSPLCKRDMLEITYGHAVCASQTISNKINCLTF